MTKSIPRLIGLTGHQRTGKDTTAQILCEEFGFVRLAYADAIRDTALKVDPLVPLGGEVLRLSTIVELNGWEYTKTEVPEVRRVLQRLGVAIRQLDSTFWVSIVARQAADLRAEGTSVVITDVRFPNEGMSILGAGGQVWRVTRDTGITDDHISESAMDTFKVRHEVPNNGTIEHLRHIVRSFVL